MSEAQTNEQAKPVRPSDPDFAPAIAAVVAVLSRPTAQRHIRIEENWLIIESVAPATTVARLRIVLLDIGHQKLTPECRHFATHLGTLARGMGTNCHYTYISGALEVDMGGMLTNLTVSEVVIN